LMQHKATPRVATLLLLLITAAAPMLDDKTFGFVGTGTMSSAIVRGLSTLASPPRSIVLSPRNAEKAAALKEQFPELVCVATDNQAVVDQSDVIFVGVLPKIAEETLRALRFQPRHTVISLVSTATLPSLREWCAPVPPASVVRAIPLPPVAMHRGASLVTPKHSLALAVFEALGTPVVVETEAAMKKMMSVTALMGQFYAQQRETLKWLEAEGVDPASAAKFTGAVFHCFSFDSAQASEHTFAELVDEQTPGGLNEQVVRELTESGAFSALTDALDGVLARVEGRERPAKRKRPYTSEAV